MTDVNGKSTVKDNDTTGNANPNKVRKPLSERRADAHVAKLAKAATRATKAAKAKAATAKKLLVLKAKAERMNAANAAREAKRLAREQAAKAKADAAEARKMTAEAKGTSLDVLIANLIDASKKASNSARVMAIRLNDDLGLGWHLLDPKAGAFNDNQRETYKQVKQIAQRTAEAYVAAGNAIEGKYMPMHRVKKHAALEYDKAMGIVRETRGANERKPLVVKIKDVLPGWYAQAMEAQNTVEDEVEQRKFGLFATKLGELLVLAGVDLTSLNKKA